MNRARLVGRSLLHFRATHLGVLAGTALGAAVLTGALLVGDSVQTSLRTQAEQRIGRVELAVGDGQRLFGATLADDVAGAMAGITAAPLLQFAGVAASSDGSRRALDVQVLGVDRRFFALGPDPAGSALPSPPPGAAWLSRSLAARLQAQAGERLVLRIDPPAGMPHEAVLAGAERSPRALAVQIDRVVDAAEFGRFGLDAAPMPPLLAIVALDWLQAQLAQPGRANLLLLGGDARPTPAAAADAVRSHWTLADAGLSVRTLAGGDEQELDSDAVLLPPVVVAAAAGLPQRAMGVSTWLAKEVRLGARSVPYALLSGLGPATARPEPAPTPPPWHAVLPASLPDDGIVLGRWLADDLQARPGDAVELCFWRHGADRELVETTRTLRVAAIVEREGLAADRELMPPFPGIAGARSCRDWQSGLPIVKEHLRERDEQYWREHGGTPKAFVGLAAAQAMWGDERFGALTALRFETGVAADFLAGLRQALDPATLGLSVRDVRTPTLAASTPTTDFGGLFVGLSFFLIGAAVLLAALLLGLGVLQRSAELGTLLAIGFRPRTVRGLLFAEAAALASTGALAGALLAPGVAQLLLMALGSVWSDAVAGAAIDLAVRPAVLLTGGAVTGAAAMLAAWSTLARQVRQPAVELLAQRHGVAAPTAPAARRRLAARLVAAGALGAVAAATWGALAAPPQRPAAAFLAGTALLVAGLAGCRWALLRRHAASAPERLTLPSFARSNVARRPARSLAAIALLASGTFLLVVVGANHKLPPAEPDARSAGTGGFQLLGRSALPVLGERTAAGAGFRLTSDQPANVAVVPLRVRDGDEASCRNLNRPQSPRLLGVPTRALSGRGAFTFRDGEGPAGASAWELLLGDDGGDGDTIPAIGDAASVAWSLHRGLGDVVPYTDEHGRTFGLRIVATLADSILQGSLLIDERHFLRRFPSTVGHRMFLIDAPPTELDRTAAALMHALADQGLEVVPTRERLRELDAVQNTYLGVFQVLGGLGLLLGSAGLGIVLLRNLAERRGELALLQAIGFRQRTLQRLLAQEHGVLLVAGLGTGAAAALLTIAVQLRGAALALPFGIVATLLAAMLFGGGLLLWLAAARALRRPQAADLAGQ